MSVEVSTLTEQHLFLHVSISTAKSMASLITLTIMLPMKLLLCLLVFFRAFLVNRLQLAAENLALRQQLAVLQRSSARPKLRPFDRCFWVWLSTWFQPWRSWLVLVKPETVIAWHRQGFRWYWRWKSGGKPGRPTLDAEVRALIRQMAIDNPTWGTPRITSELHLLGYHVGESTVAKYRPHIRKPPSQHWRTFLVNHLGSMASMDFLVVPTATFRLLYVLVVLVHERRKVAHFNVTTNPTAAWVAQQLREAFPFDTAPCYLIRDRDGIYGREVRQTLQSLGIQEVLTAPRSPWQNPYVERLHGSIRRECLDHVIVLNERHLRRQLSSYFHYYHTARCHLSLKRNAPFPREVEPVLAGRVVADPMVGGLHHRYRRAA